MLSVLSKKPVEKPPKDAGVPIRVIANTLVVFIASQLLAVFTVGLLLVFTHPGKGANYLLNASIAGQFLYVLVAEGLAAWLTITLVRRRGLRLSFIGLGRKPDRRDLLMALKGIVLVYALVIIVNLLLAFIPGVNTNQKQDVGFTNITSLTDNILAFIALVILPPLGEEPLMRGYLYSGLRARWSYGWSMIATSLLFGAAHLEVGSGSPLVWGAAIHTFVLSLVLVYLREKSGALYAGMGVHMINNVIAFLVIVH